MSLAGRTAFIAGATRGIGKAIAFKLAENGANVIIGGKTQSLHRFLPGTIFSVADEINSLYGEGRALPFCFDVRQISMIKNAVSAAVKTFGSLDILVNNCSAIKLKKLSNLASTEINLMFDINILGPYNCIRETMGHLSSSKFGGHVVNISPPIDKDPAWFSNHAVYSLSKIGQSLTTFGLSDVLSDLGIAVNSLWSKNVINTGTSQYIYGKNITPHTCSPDLMAEALLKIVLKKPQDLNGKFFFAEDLVLDDENPSELENYTLRNNLETALMPNLFHGKGEECIDTRDYIKKMADVICLFDRINKSLLPDQTESVGGVFTIKFLDLDSAWTIDCKSKNLLFHEVTEKQKIDGSPCQLIMNTNTLRDILDKKLNAESSAFSQKIRLVGNRAIALRAQALLFDII